jgi:hypothetical protein
MRRFLLIPLLLLPWVLSLKAQVVLEDFEGGTADLTWSGLNGDFNGVVANPDPNSVNASAFVGSYTNNDTFDYNFALGTLAAPLDLSVNNQFSIQLWAPTATQVLFKLEGGGNQIETVRDVAVTGEWQTYYFDFSAASGFTTLDRILIVFSPGVVGSTDTYYIDNIVASPNLCPGVPANPEVLDNFDCDRNATYGAGWDSLDVIDNPDVDADNPSLKVGKFSPEVGSSFAALVFSHENPINLTVRNQFCLKVWSPKAGDLLLKIEGGTSAKEIHVPMTETNQWVEYCVDFCDEAGEGHTRLVVFFNAGVAAEPGDMYFFDDVRLSPLGPLEDFEGDINLAWGIIGSAVLNGMFEGPVANPQPNSVNNSPEVGKYTKGSSPLSTLTAIPAESFNLKCNPQFNIDVLSPAGVGGTVTMQLFSATQGGKEQTATITTPGEWERLSFNFAEFDDITDFGEIRLIFNAGTVAAGQVWYIDNLGQGLTTINPCLTVEAIPYIIDDFECQRNHVTIFYGASDLSVVDNPFPTVDNPSTMVGQYNDPPNQGFSGIGYELPGPPDLSVLNQLQVSVYSTTDNVPFLFKLEGGATAVEIRDTLTEPNKWFKFNIDFSGAIGTDNFKLVIFPNVESNDAGTFYIDNIKWARSEYSGCIADFETPPYTLSNFVYLNNDNTTDFEVVDNPDPDAINPSNRVGEYEQDAQAGIYHLIYHDLDAPIRFNGDKRIRMKVHMDHIGTVTAKVETFGNPVPGIEVTLPNTKVNEWEELEFDFSAVPDTAEGRYFRFTLFFDITTTGTGSTVVSYFDDIVIGSGECLPVGAFEPAGVVALHLSPNPATDRLRVGQLDGLDRLVIFNAFGQQLSDVPTLGHSAAEIDVAALPAGLYSLAGFDRQGRLLGNAKFVKQ